jgi:hypothetical protein
MTATRDAAGWRGCPSAWSNPNKLSYRQRVPGSPCLPCDLARCPIAPAVARVFITVEHASVQPYWIKVERRTGPSLGGAGVGVTARSETDARSLVELGFGKTLAALTIEPVVDICDLDRTHVGLNMGNWFQGNLASLEHTQMC